MPEHGFNWKPPSVLFSCHCWPLEKDGWQQFSNILLPCCLMRYFVCLSNSKVLALYKVLLWYETWYIWYDISQSVGCCAVDFDGVSVRQQTELWCCSLEMIVGSRGWHVEETCRLEDVGDFWMHGDQSSGFTVFIIATVTTYRSLRSTSYCSAYIPGLVLLDRSMSLWSHGLRYCNRGSLV